MVPVYEIDYIVALTEHCPGRLGRSFKFFYTQSRPEFRPSLYLKKCCIVTHHYTKLPQIKKPGEKTPNLQQIKRFFGQISQNSPNFANWVHWMWNGYPPSIYQK